MIDGPHEVSSKPPFFPQNEPKETIAPKDKTSFHEGFAVGSSPQPFVGMQMTSAEKKKFWNIFMQQMGQVIKKNLARARKASKELKKSWEEN